MVSGMGGQDLKTAHRGQIQQHTVASQQVLPMVDHVAGTGVMLRNFLEGGEERLP
jgi:hypothetical protein